jgi:hypothetical protein
MSYSPEQLFTAQFVGTLQTWIHTHHTLYPRVPPRGIYFESLVERTFVHSGWSRDEVALENPNSPRADIRIGDTRLSLKTETGRGTQRERISITKLCTTETGEWTSTALIDHALNHLTRYEGILMLRAIWTADGIDYQLLDVPVSLLQRMSGCIAKEIGTRTGRRSLSLDVKEGDSVLFRVNFDGADGKCQVRALRVDHCIMLAEWTQPYIE